MTSQQIKTLPPHWRPRKRRINTFFQLCFSISNDQAKILNFHHNWDIVVLASYKHCRGISFNVYGTPGLGLEFIGTKKEPSTTGNAVLQCFRSFMKGTVYIVFVFPDIVLVVQK